MRSGSNDSMGVDSLQWWMRLVILSVLIAASFGGELVVAIQPTTPLLLQPHLQGDKVVFVAHGDIWATSESENWRARNLTQSTVAESHPKISPDGLWVAYNHPLDGVWVVPFAGGQAKQLTFYGNQGPVFGWTIDNRIAYGSDESAPFPDSTGLSFVRPTGGQPQHTGVTEIGYAWFDPQGAAMIFSKSGVTTGISAKLHGGGGNQILRLHLQTGSYEHLYPAIWSRHSAVVIQDQTYFVGTEGETALNLWQVGSTGLRRLTDFAIDGVRTITSDGTRLILERGGQLFWFDVSTNRMLPISISLVDPAEPLLTIEANVPECITEVAVTEDGSAVAVVARGEILVHDKGDWTNISRSSGANDSMAYWSHDGQILAFVSDRSRQHEIFLWNRGTGQVRKLTGCSRMPVWLAWSPAGDGLYYLLDREAVRWVDLQSSRDDSVATIDRWVTNYTVSADGCLLALTTALENQRTRVILVDRNTKQSYRVTDPRYVDTSCVFDAHENWLYFLSRRNGRPDLNQEIPNLNLSGGMSLARIDLRDLANISEQTDFRQRTRWINSDNRDLEQLSIHPRGFLASGSQGAWILDRNSLQFEPLAAPPTAGEFSSTAGGARVKLDHAQISIDRWQDGWVLQTTRPLPKLVAIDLRQEWESMFWAVHRFHADQFYDRQLLGVDWPAIGRHYAQYLPRIGSREDLTVLMSRMTGELPGGHNGVNGPPATQVTQARPRAPDSGLIVGWDGSGAKIFRVLRGRTDMQMFGSLESGVEGKLVAGQYIRSVNGQSILETRGFDELIAGIHPTEMVTLEVSEHPSGPTTTVSVQFLDNYLGYNDFLERTIERVAQRSHGRIGYAHVFDTYSQGGGSFADGFYSQWNLAGFILDARWNRGGNANPGFIDALQAKALFREVKKWGQPSLDTPSITGPIVLLVNRETVSGGELLARGFQVRKVGVVIGDRTAGRTIGNQWYGQLIDGGSVRTSESHNQVWPSGEDAGENRGVGPDLEIERIPTWEFSIDDSQLDQAITTILEKIK